MAGVGFRKDLESNCHRGISNDDKACKICPNQRQNHTFKKRKEEAQLAYERWKEEGLSTRRITSRKIARSQFLRGEPVRRLWGQRGVNNVYQTKTINIGKNRIEVKPPNNLRDFTQTLDQIITSMNKTKNKRFIHIDLPKYDSGKNFKVDKTLQGHGYAKKIKWKDIYRNGKIIIDSKHYRKVYAGTGHKIYSSKWAGCAY